MSALVAILAVAGFRLHSKLPDLTAVGAAIISARPGLLVLAVLAEAVSLRHFALQQRRLLAAFGVGMSIPRAIAVTVSRSAMSFALPAGSAVSAAYAFRQFRTAGASRRAAGSVILLSGLMSGAGLATMYGLVLLLPASGTASAHQTVLLVSAVLAAALLVFAVDWIASRRLYVPVEAQDEPPPAGAGRVRRAILAVRSALDQLRRLPPRSALLSLLHATVNWATDLACLAAVAAAFGLPVSFTELATVYLTVQLVRQIPLSPGGIGVIEVALLAGLVSAGAANGVAAAAVLVYRLVSCWLVIPVGGLAYALLGRRTGQASGERRRERARTTSTTPVAAMAEPINATIR
jgi:uncharacterized protein (TIRG00374 family)